MFQHFYPSVMDYWANEASPTLGCSIEISRDIYIYMYVCMYVCMSLIVYGTTIQKIECQNAWAEIRSPNTRTLKNQFWEFETKCRL